jgi:hypothetical protein
VIDECKDFHNEVIQMLTQSTLRTKEAMSKEILVVEELRKNIDVC